MDFHAPENFKSIFTILILFLIQVKVNMYESVIRKQGLTNRMCKVPTNCDEATFMLVSRVQEYRLPSELIKNSS